MRKSLLLGTSTAFAMILTACTTGSVGQVEAVYGPPPTEVYEHDDPVEDVYGPPVESWDEDDGPTGDGAEEPDADESEDGDAGEKGYNASEREDSDSLVPRAVMYGVPVGRWAKGIADLR